MNGLVKQQLMGLVWLAGKVCHPRRRAGTSSTRGRSNPIMSTIFAALRLRDSHIFLSYDINKLTCPFFSLGSEEKGKSAFMVGLSLSISVWIAFGELYAFSKSWLQW